MPPPPIRIVVDAMGGDNAPEVNIAGALSALEEDENLEIVLTGDQQRLRAHIAKSAGSIPERLTLVHASEVISMEDHAASAIRKKKDSSIHVGLNQLKNGHADAFISAGNSGAIMAGALLLLGRLPQVERPAIIIRIPTADGYVIILDAGANVDCKPSHLVQFAEMGHVYAQVIEGMERPRLGLLANGSESHKGNELTRDTHALLENREGLEYQGYVEGFDLFRGTTDVVICDGFVGNVILKVTEGLADTTFKWFRAQVKRDVFGMMGVVLLSRVMKAFKAKFDYQPYGSAPLLGINGMVLISHGSSTEVAIRNGILTAKRGVEQKFVEKIGARLEKSLAPNDNTVHG